MTDPAVETNFKRLLVDHGVKRFVEIRSKSGRGVFPPPLLLLLTPRYEVLELHLPSFDRTDFEVALLRGLAQQSGSLMAVMVTDAWISSTTPPDGKRISEMPDRQDALSIAGSVRLTGEEFISTRPYVAKGMKLTWGEIMEDGIEVPVVRNGGRLQNLYEPIDQSEWPQPMKDFFQRQVQGYVDQISKSVADVRLLTYGRVQ